MSRRRPDPSRSQDRRSGWTPPQRGLFDDDTGSGRRARSTRKTTRQPSRSRQGSRRASTTQPARSRRAKASPKKHARRSHRPVPPRPKRRRQREKITERAARKVVTVASTSSPRSGRKPFMSSPRARLRLMATLIVLGFVVIMGYVVKYQVVDDGNLRAAAASQWTRSRVLSSDRGSIFDRNGEELALSVPAVSIDVNPRLVEDPVMTAAALKLILNLSDERTDYLTAEMAAHERGFVYVKRQVDVSLGEQIKALGLAGVNVVPEDRRILPGGTTGRSVIGLTDIDRIGIAGLEYQYGGQAAAAADGYDDLLTGVTGRVSYEVDKKGQPIAGTDEVIVEPVAGHDLVLTIDRSIQFSAEQALLSQVKAAGAKSGTVVIMDVRSGDIYAMASVDRDDDGSARVSNGNYAAVNAYEPGSVAKVITIAAGLNEGVVTPESSFVVPYRRTYGDDELSDSHKHDTTPMTVEEILVQSSNIGTIDVLEATGFEAHWNYMRSFGLGEKTALDFPGESAGILHRWDELQGSERYTVAYGQGVASTSLQLASVINTIANDGIYVAPRLVTATIGTDGDQILAPSSATHEVVRPETAHEVQDMMRKVVCEGTAAKARDTVTGFTVAGKTGTGLKPWPNGSYVNASGQKRYYSSFVGFFPVEAPEVTILVSIDEPDAALGYAYGGDAAAPVFAELVPKIASVLGLQPPANAIGCEGDD
ncbi:MAG: hypothetical protein CSA55_02840 [Ilumatobacter coccineus]|uniref:Cell division protein FtsI n=1 Tax=Ilumatobacter coccineus TaxID=467094 RepID=A0A2G6KBV9_9ACTN|nr:MAG: hypothetical protein CSA55_02840 [Ilumatobacter coccineus]